MMEEAEAGNSEIRWSALVVVLSHIWRTLIRLGRDELLVAVLRPSSLWLVGRVDGIVKGWLLSSAVACRRQRRVLLVLGESGFVGSLVWLQVPVARCVLGVIGMIGG